MRQPPSPSTVSGQPADADPLEAQRRDRITRLAALNAWAQAEAHNTFGPRHREWRKLADASETLLLIEEAPR